MPSVSDSPFQLPTISAANKLAIEKFRERSLRNLLNPKPATDALDKEEKDNLPKEHVMAKFNGVNRTSFEAMLQTPERSRPGVSLFGDKRLQTVFHEMQDGFQSAGSAILSKISETRKENDSHHRFLDNENVTLKEVIYRSTELPQDRIKGQNIHVLIDGQAINVRALSSDIASKEEIGTLTDGSTGFYMVSAVVLNADTGEIIGIGDIVLHSRPYSDVILTPEQKAEKHNKRRNELENEERTSHAFRLAAEGTYKQLGGAAKVIFTIDREGDDYKLLNYILTLKNTSILTRSKSDRVVSREYVNRKPVVKKISDVLRDTPSKQCELYLPKLDHPSRNEPGGRKKRKERVALMNVKYFSTKLIAPESFDERHKYPSIDVQIVDCLEDSSTVPEGEKPVHWRLITTEKVDSLDEALIVLHYYRNRWIIEESHRVFKKDGFDIEGSEIAIGHKLKKAAVMVYRETTRAIALVKARDGDEDIPIQTQFSEQEIAILEVMNVKYEGKVERQKNPHSPDQLAFASWVIGRMGGWKPDNVSRKAGPIVMREGLNKLNIIVAYENFKSGKT